MKKFLLILTTVACLFTLNVKAATLPEVTDHEKVTIYIFRGHGCSHCYAALEYLYDNINKYSDYITVKAYEVSNTNNSALMQSVASEKNETVKGVPYIVVGSNYSAKGYADGYGEKIINAALDAYKDDDYVDLVAKVAKSTSSIAESQTLEEAASAEGITSSSSSSTSDDSTSYNEEKTNNKYDVYIISGILLVVIGGIAALMLTNKKK